MKKFVKGNISTIVEDDDRRIPMYLAGGWKEEKLTARPESEAESRMKKAIEDVVGTKRGTNRSKKKSVHEDKQVNEAIVSTETAAAESVPVDDGLFKKEEA